jgi:hypothetical protein
MKTQINGKVKLSLNKRTIVLLNEQTMYMVNGGGEKPDTRGPDKSCMTDTNCIRGPKSKDVDCEILKLTITR